ncbi:hypothetical protein BSY239_2906 [Hydrogenophaga sp. RAC07]|jgi:hypothetical protein|uniref:hypothetical protein n=1 Tax=Hydrogenophaga sp. RAC07 TaxID=1842537 RepID=UPI00083DFFC9|nr:hypothetical protein [Hydrogenophaga sp. RAC07]AOF84685.1 hypothetical protein BSY239_2906 [Hydrogenophaga sp. RAC07]
MREAAAGIDRAGYKAALNRFDAALCEAIAVSQASAGRFQAANVGYASYVFTQMCGAATSMIRAAPLTRWVRSDFEDWRFGAVAGHARSLFDGYLLFNYLMGPTSSEAELKARINVMHLNDCTRRMELHKNLGITDDLEDFERQRAELQGRLSGNEHFKSLPAAVQKNCMNGRFLTIDTRDEMLAKVEFEKGQFDALYDLWSQHIHILPLSFYRIEPNGRGTGLENDTDRTYIAQALEICATVLTNATDMMEEQFPDVAPVRRGMKSTFSPGPAGNRPRKAKSKAENPPAFQQSSISAAIKKSVGS